MSDIYYTLKQPLVVRLDMNNKYCKDCEKILHKNCKNIEFCKDCRLKYDVCEICSCKTKGRGLRCSKCKRIGLRHSAETKVKMSDNSYIKDHGLSEVAKRKISETRKKKIKEGEIKNWQEGLTKETDNRLKLMGEKISKTRIEKGLSKGRKNHFSRIKFEGEKNGMYGRSVLDIWIEKYGEKEALIKWKNKYKNLGSGLSKKFECMLIDWNFKYEKEYIISYILNGRKRSKFYDFYLNDFNILIEVDGYHFHHEDSTFPRINERIENDKFKNKLAKERGFGMVRVWEDNLDKRWDIII
jgi:hypothetical protein